VRDAVRMAENKEARRMVMSGRPLRKARAVDAAGANLKLLTPARPKLLPRSTALGDSGLAAEGPPLLGVTQAEDA